MRKLFLDSHKPKNEKEFKLYEMYSDILINMIYLKCRYEKKTEKMILTYIKKNRKNLMNLFS
jgi:hypothetical protein